MSSAALPFGRLWRTARYLRRDQLAAQVRHRLVHPAAPPRDRLPAPEAGWPKLAPLCARADRAGGPRVRILGVEAELHWRGSGQPRLWMYHLHYHDFLRHAILGGSLIQNWIEANPPGSKPAWEAYPLSRRIVNWIAAHREAPPPAVAQSLALQARALAANLEDHLLANHLFVNAKALIFAGACFSGQEADRWLATGLRILNREIPEQILLDGGHFERSPMYHALILEDLLDLENLRQHAPRLASLRADCFTPPIAPMRSWLKQMSASDGELCQFQDTAQGVAPAPPELEDYAARLGLAASAFPARLRESRYARLDQGEATVWVDLGGPAPDYQPGHSHAAALAFEFSLGGRRLIVNSGISTYDQGRARAYERSTAAHNTAVVGRIDQSEMWGAFRVGRRATVSEIKMATGWVQATQDGYAPVLHHRRLELGARTLEITDRFSEVEDPIPVDLYLHFRPGLRLNETSPGCWEVTDTATDTGAVLLRILTPAGLTGSVGDGNWRPRFYEQIPNQTLRFSGELCPKHALFLTRIEFPLP